MEIQALAIFTPVFMRCFGMTVALPLGDSAAMHWRLGLAAGLALFVCSSGSTSTNWTLISLPIEFLIGLFLGLPAALVVSLSASFGELFDVQRGQLLGSIYDPVSSEVSSPSAILFSNIIWAMLCAQGFLETLFTALLKSFSLVAAGGGTILTLSVVSRSLFKLMCFSFTGCVMAFLPLALFLVFIDGAFGFIAKAIPNLTLTSEATQLKSALGWLVLNQCYGLFLGGWLFEAVRPLIGALGG